MTIKVIGIDIAKNVFQLHGIDSEGRTLLRKRVRRSEFLLELSLYPSCLIGLEAGSGAHHWAAI